MHLGCFKQENAVGFACKTYDMNQFRCECVLINNSGIESDFYCLNTSYSDFWFHNQGQKQEKIAAKYLWDGKVRNLANLTDSCIDDIQIQDPYPVLYCNTYKDKVPYEAYCNCLNGNGFGESPGLVYSAEHVYPNRTMYNDDGKLLTSMCTESMEHTDISSPPPITFDSHNSSQNNDLSNSTFKFVFHMSNSLIPIVVIFILFLIVCLIFLFVSMKKYGKKLKSFFILIQFIQNKTIRREYDFLEETNVI